MSAVRADQNRFKPGSTPTISRTARLPSGVPGRSANRTPRRVTSSASIRVLYRSLAADGRLEQDTPIQGQPATIQGLHLVRDRDVGVQVRVAGAGVTVGERGRDQPCDVDLPDAGAAGAGE